MVLTIHEEADDEGEMVVNICLLADESAPKELLALGSMFELFEGRHCVATGKVCS